MTNEEIIARLRAGVPVARIVREGLGIPAHSRPTLYRVRTVQRMYCPETVRRTGPDLAMRYPVKRGRVQIGGWACQWVEVGERVTDAEGNVVSMRIEVSE